VAEAATGRQDSKKSLDMVQLRELLGELVERKESSALLEVVFGVLLKAEKVIEDQAIEIQQLRKLLFGRRSEKLSPDQLSLFTQMLATVTAVPSKVDAPGDAGAAMVPPKKKSKRAPRRPLTPTQSHEILIPDGERDCPQCGGPRCTFDHARALVIEYTPPKIDVIEYRREKVVCRRCEGEITVAAGSVGADHRWRATRPTAAPRPRHQQDRRWPAPQPNAEALRSQWSRHSAADVESLGRGTAMNCSGPSSPRSAQLC
jgi:hypothetical protein